MKKICLITLLLFTCLASERATAQLRVGLNVNLGIQPQWGPEGYNHASYYYIPDIDVFYNVSTEQYIYEEDGRWIFARSLPNRYDNYDLYNGYKVVVNSRTPYRRANIYREKYARYKDNHNQHIIRDSHDSRYFENVNHPQHQQWQRDRDQNRGYRRNRDDNRRRDNDNGGNNGRGNDKGGEKGNKPGGKGNH
jgi:hypothetical protein